MNLRQCFYSFLLLVAEQGLHPPRWLTCCLVCMGNMCLAGLCIDGRDGLWGLLAAHVLCHAFSVLNCTL